MADGSLLPVGDVAEGAELLVFDTRRLVHGTGLVLHVRRGSTKRMVVINDQWCLTEAQQVLADGRFVRAGDLRVNQTLVGAGLTPVPIRSLSLADESADVASLELASEAAFYIQADSADVLILVREAVTGKDALGRDQVLDDPKLAMRIDDSGAEAESSAD